MPESENRNPENNEARKEISSVAPKKKERKNSIEILTSRNNACIAR